MRAVKKLTPDTLIGMTNGMSIGDFWAWAYSDLLNNTQRGVLAEFLVAAALGITDRPRIVWDAYDLLYQDKRIEVKAAAYVQTWQQARPSRISFSIGERRAWYAERNEYSARPVRAADCYVFCLYAETDWARANVLDLDQWQFFVIPTTALEAEVGSRQRIGLARVAQLCGKGLDYTGLRRAVDRALGLT